jgi:hypothetical protein
MGMFEWLRKHKEGASSAILREEKQPLAKNVENVSTDKEQFQSPTLLAAWVTHWLLEKMPLEDNYKALPDEESRKSLNITYEQRERYVREIVVLRIAGISLFVKKHNDDIFWLAFSQSIYPLLAKYLNSDSYSTTSSVIADAVESYVKASEQSDEEKIAALYMRRVYDDSDHFLKLKMAGVGYLAVQWLMDSYEVFQDTYRQVT